MLRPKRWFTLLPESSGAVAPGPRERLAFSVFSMVAILMSVQCLRCDLRFPGDGWGCFTGHLDTLFPEVLVHLPGRGGAKSTFHF